MRYPKLAFVGLVLFTLVGIGLGLSPIYVRWKVHHDHPDMTVESVSFRWKVLNLSGVHVDRGWLKGTLRDVTVDFDRVITITGGELTVDLDSRPKSEASEGKRSVSFHNMALHLTKAGAHAELSGASLSAGNLCFASGTLQHPSITGVLQSGCVAVDGSKAHMDGALVSPRGLPFFHDQTVNVQNLDLDPKAKLINVESVHFDVDAPHQPATIRADGVHAFLDEAGITVQLSALSVDHPWLSAEHAVFHNISTSVPLGTSLPELLDVSISNTTVHVDRQHLAVHGAEDCQAWATALPEGLRDGPLEHPEFSGKLTFDVALKPQPKVKIDSTCKFTCSSASVQELRHLFSYSIYTDHGDTIPRASGPLAADWMPTAYIGSQMPLAVMSSEDPGFLKHNGFISAALENSFADDLRVGKFVRGGSTITMQLAKNLWLSRQKTLGRKVEELLLATVLESCFTKDELMELYLNVVEFGPNLYGIGAAAKHYFKVLPYQLDPAQTFYLASILPAPRKAPTPDAAVMARMGKLMENLVAAGRLPDGIMMSYHVPDMHDWKQP